MKIASGIIKPDSGERAVTKGARVSYLPQTDVVVGENSVFEEAEKAYGFAAAMLVRQEEIGRLLESSTADDEATARLLEEHAHIQDAVEGSGYWRRRDRCAMSSWASASGNAISTGPPASSRAAGRCA